jgi:hypothetical protein
MTQAQFCIHFVLAVLATWRVAHLLASEDGPADVIVKLRLVLGDSVAGRLMDCFKCLSLWIAAPAALFVTRAALDWLFVWLALSGAACLLQLMVSGAAQAQPFTQTSEGDVSHVLRPETIDSAGDSAERANVGGRYLYAAEPAYPSHGNQAAPTGQ